MSGAGDGTGYLLTSDDDDFWGRAQEAVGLFAPRRGGPGRVELLGCAPQGALRDRLDRVGGIPALLGNARLVLLDHSGAGAGSYFINDLTLLAARPSSRQEGPADLTLTLRCDALLPHAARPWHLLRTGGMTRTGLWHSLGPAGRHAWLSVALNHHGYRAVPDAPPGTVYALDGRHIVDADSFYCALGEAVNGPGGYFGWNLDALDDCLSGGWGAAPPFTLHWHHHALAGSRPAQRRTRAGAPLLKALMEVFADHHIDVIPR